MTGSYLAGEISLRFAPEFEVRFGILQSVLKLQSLFSQERKTGANILRGIGPLSIRCASANATCDSTAKSTFLYMR